MTPHSMLKSHVPFSSFVDVLRCRAKEQGAAPAFALLPDGDSGEQALTWEELDRNARGIAATLQAMDAAGRHALLLYPFGLEYVAAFLGALYARVVAVPVYPPDPSRLDRTLPRLRAIARDAQATLVLTTRAIRGMVDALVAQAPEFAALQWVATDALDEGAASAWRDPGAHADTLAFLQYTSGSTSTPKGVLVTHGNLLHNEELSRGSTRIGRDSVFVSWLPMYHDMGLIGGLLHPLYAGAPCVLMPPQAFLQKPLRWVRAISRYRATISGGPNFAFDLCVRKVTQEDLCALDLRCWTYAFNGAEPVRRDTLERFARHFAPCGFRPEALRPLYGLAEATLMVSGGERGTEARSLFVDGDALGEHRVVVAAEGSPGARPIVSCGRTWLDQRIAIVDPLAGAACAPGRVGEIWIQGPSVARGYWNRVDETYNTFQAFFRDPATGAKEGPYLRTGDLGFLHEGELYLTGRLKDVLIIRGRNHYPQDIERTVEESHPALRPGCGAAFRIDTGGEERLVVVHELYRDGADTDGDAVARAVRQAVAEVHGLGLHALVLLRQGAIPKTSSGKIQRDACRRGFVEGTLDVAHASRSAQTVPPRSSARPDRGADRLLKEIGRLVELRPEDVDRSQNVLELGLDSLSVMELKLEAEDLYGGELSPRELYRPIGELMQSLSQRELPLHVPAGDALFEVKWDVARHAPALHSHLLEVAPWVLPHLDQMRSDVPVPPTNNSFDSDDMFRPPGHFRAFYVRGHGDAVLALKGADIRCDDQQSFLQMLHQRSFERFAKFSVTNALEYFLLQERKVPGALLLSEGLTEAQRAAELQTTFVDRFGELGALPVPLLVLRWSDEVALRFRTSLLPLLSGHALSIAERELEGGLGCYIYYFPCAPFPRVSHFAGTLAQESVRTGTAGIPNTRLIYTTLKHNLNPGKIIDSWLSLVARMLLCGYFPSDAQHFKNGQCIEPQNVLLNGAVADVDSVTPMRSLGSDREFYTNFLVMLNLLANTVRVFLIAENNGTTTAPSPFPAQFPKPDFLDILSIIHIWERLKAHLVELMRVNPGELDPRLGELVTENLSFPVLFDKVLFALHYAGPQIPESVLHMLNITDVYSNSANEHRKPVPRLSYEATIKVDAAALATIPRSFLEQLRMPAGRFVQDVLKGEAMLLNVYETFLGRIGLIVLPLDDASIYADRQRTAAAVQKGLAHAARLGAGTVSLTGLIPSATDYGRALGNDGAGAPPRPRLTTGHATTVACFVMMIERILREAGRTLDAEDVTLLGLGSIGTGILSLMLEQLPHPRRLLLCELPARRDHLVRLREQLIEGHGYHGDVELVTIPGDGVPGDVYGASLILSATSVPNLVDVDRLRPGTLIIDDSAPHCFEPRRAVRRFQQRRDLLFTEAGALRSDRPIGEISDLSLSTGWDHKVRAALRLLHPREDTIMGCVFSSILTERFDDAPAVIGTPTRDDLKAHYAKLLALRFEGARLYCEDYVLDDELVRMFRERTG